MKAKTAPTSPKFNLESTEAANNETLAKVWQEPMLQQPARIPVLTLAVWALGCSLIGLVLIGGGAFWYLKQVPSSRLKDFLPAMVTTVIENVPTSTTTEPPSAVKQLTDTVVPLVTVPAADTIISDTQLTGTAVALSSSGWLLSLTTAIPDGATMAAVTSQRATASITTTIHDPAGPFVFLKSDSTTLKAANFAGPSKVKAGQTVWVIIRRLNATIALRRQLLPAPQVWQSCDQASIAWVLDQAINAVPGSPVVTDDGQLVGLLGNNSGVWSVQSVDSALKGLFDHQTVDRPACGFSYLDGRAAAAKSTPGNGLIVGAAPGGIAIQPKGAADKAGLHTGDLITAVDGVAMTDWPSILAASQPGQTLAVTVKRGSTDVALSLTLGILHE